MCGDLFELVMVSFWIIYYFYCFGSWDIVICFNFIMLLLLFSRMGFWDEDLDGLRDRLRNCGFNPQTLTSKAVPTDVVITSSRLVKAASELKLFMAAAKPPGRASLLNKDLGPVWGKLKDVDGALADLQSCASQWMDAASTEIFQMLINSHDKLLVIMFFCIFACCFLYMH